MGGCCCCSSRRAESSSIPTYYYFPRASVEREPFSAHPDPASGLSTGLLVHTNLETSVPDTYTPPPPPVPFDVDSGNPATAPGDPIDSHGDNPDLSTQLGYAADSGRQAHNGAPPGSPEKDLKVAEGKQFYIDKSFSVDLELDELKKPGESVVLVIEECPTCLEEYDEENPKILTKCSHHFHLACILEWMERSETCPVCDQVMEIDVTLAKC